MTREFSVAAAIVGVSTLMALALRPYLVQTNLRIRTVCVLMTIETTSIPANVIRYS